MSTENKGLKKHTARYKTIEDGVRDLKSLPKYDKLRMSITVTQAVGNFIENKVKSKYKLDKVNMVIDIIDEVFQLTEDEKKQIVEQLEHLILNGNIRRDGIVKRIGKGLYSVFAYFFLPNRGA